MFDAKRKDVARLTAQARDEIDVMHRLLDGQHRDWDRLLVGVCLLTTALWVLVDYSTVLGFAAGYGYVGILLVLGEIRSLRPVHIMGSAAAASALIAVGFVTSPHAPGTYLIAAANRAGSVALVWTWAIFAWRYRKEVVAKYVDFWNNSPDLFVSVDAQTGTVVSANHTTEQFMGDVIGRNVLDMYAEQSRDAAHALFDEFVSTGSAAHDDLYLIDKHGNPLHVSVRVNAYRDRSRKVVQSRSVWRVHLVQRDA